MVERRILDITLERLKDIPLPCRQCAYWETYSDSTDLTPLEEERIQKGKWYSWGLARGEAGGKLFYYDNQGIAYAQFGRLSLFPRLSSYRVGSLVGPDAIFLSCLFVAEGFRGRGFGTLMLRSILKDLYKSKAKAIETIPTGGPLSAKPSDLVGFFLQNGFHIKEDDPQHPLLRLDFKSLVRVQDELQSFLDRIRMSLHYGTRAPVAR